MSKKEFRPNIELDRDNYPLFHLVSELCLGEKMDQNLILELVTEIQQNTNYGHSDELLNKVHEYTEKLTRLSEFWGTDLAIDYFIKTFFNDIDYGKSALWEIRQATGIPAVIMIG